MFGPALGMAAGLAVLVLVGLRSDARERFSADWIRGLEAPVSTDMVREIEKSRWLRFVGTMLGWFAGCLLAVPVGLTLDQADELNRTPASAVLVIPFVLAIVGRGILGLITTLREVSGSVRVAKSWAPRLTDYVSSTGLVVMRVEMAVILLAGLAATQSPTLTGVSFEPGQSAYAWGAIVVVALMWLTVELLARRLVARPEPSADAATLFWRDALRGEVLRSSCLLLAQLGAAVLWVISASLPRWFGTPAAATGSLIKFAVQILILLLVFAASTLMMRAPTSRRSEALLVAARTSWQGA